MSQALVDRCVDLPLLELAPGERLIAWGEPATHLYVLVSGACDVSRDDATIARIEEPGAVIGEVAALLGRDHTATVTARSDVRVRVIDDPLRFLAADHDALLEVARLLASRLDRLTGYLADVKAQYADREGHLGIIDEVLAQLAHCDQEPVEPGSDREPDPHY